jgi:hypothetical protein
MTPIQAAQTRSLTSTPRDGTARCRWRSVGAVAAGFFSVAILSVVTDEILHLLQVYPPWGQPMYEPGLNLLALAYRSLFTVAGMYLTARLAPRAPMRHALIGGAIGTVVASAGVIATMPLNLGPVWYPIALAVTALPLAWLGGALYVAPQPWNWSVAPLNFRRCSFGKAWTPTSRRCSRSSTTRRSPIAA